MWRTALLLCVALTSGCASVPPDQRVEHDPWEPMNRSVYRFNDAIDRAVAKPIARGYNKVIPEPVRNGITNFSRNLLAPSSALNNFLQGKPTQGTEELARFLFNSTFGIAGIFDVAARGGLEEQRETFGQTLAVWGVPTGPYVVLPFFGPQTVRGISVLPLEFYADPLNYYDNTSVRDKIYVLRAVNARARFLSFESVLEESQDRYVTVRESFLQNLEFRVYDGDPPVDDDEDLYDEFLEEEDY